MVSIAPTFISRPYRFTFDEAGYLQQSITVSRAFWQGNAPALDRLREVRSAMDGIRPPAMTVLALPWGAPRSWDVAGNCFLTLACCVSILAVFSLYLLTRIGTEPLLVVLSSLCVSAALGPIPPHSVANFCAAGLMADSLFAWTCLAALLLIPYEMRTAEGSLHRALLRGIIWGLILSLRMMTKISFLYFVSLILPILFLIRYRRGGLSSCWPGLAGFLIAAAPSAVYLLRYGRSSWANGGATSFGTLSKLYELPFLRFVEESLRDSPGLAVSAIGTLTGFGLLAIKRRQSVLKGHVVTLLILIGFCLITLASPNRQIRYLFPAIIACLF